MSTKFFNLETNRFLKPLKLGKVSCLLDILTTYQFCSCVDTSGNWGHGGMFDALARLSTSVPTAYERASEFGDLHLGDLHLIEITGKFGALTSQGHLFVLCDTTSSVIQGFN